MTNEELFVSVALNAWRSNIERANKIFGGLTAKELLQEVAPGKNRLIYLWCHLTAVHDAMLPLLGFGKRLHPEFDAAFISNPDKTQASVPSVADIGNAWKDVNNKLFEGFATFSTADWLQKHAAVSAEDFVKEPSSKPLRDSARPHESHGPSPRTTGFDGRRLNLPDNVTDTDMFNLKE